MASKQASSSQTGRDPQAFLPQRYARQSFSPELWQRFSEAAAALGLSFSAEQKLRLEALYSHLLGVNAWLNLTRLSSPEEYLILHVLDSLTALELCKKHSRPGDLLLDLGSGAGYPGLPLAMHMTDRKFLLLDSRRKKAEFLKHTIALLPEAQLQALCFRGREVARHCPEIRHACTVLTARAVGAAAELLLDAEQLLKPGGHLLLLKGPKFLQEENEQFEQACQKLGFKPELAAPVQLPELGQERYLVLAKKL